SEPPAPRELTVSHGALLLPRARDNTGRDAKLTLLHTQAVSGELQQSLPSFRGSRAYAGGRSVDAGAADLRPLVAREIRVERRGRHLVHTEIELFGGDLQHPRQGPLPKLTAPEIER